MRYGAPCLDWPKANLQRSQKGERRDALGSRSAEDPCWLKANLTPDEL